MKAMKSSITLTREQLAEIVTVLNAEFQENKSLATMTLFFDPDAVTVAEWEIHPDCHPFIAL